jgi:hypothetical protein
VDGISDRKPRCSSLYLSSECSVQTRLRSGECLLPNPVKKELYIDNAKFLAALKAYRLACYRAKRRKHSKPRIPEYLGECFLKLATRISTKPNFKSYTYRDDMISDATENCCQYLYNFNPNKGTNPFGYFTTMIHYAFIRRIEREKKHTYLKYKLMEKGVIDGTQSYDPSESSGQPDTTMLNFENVQEFITRFDERMAKRRVRRKVKELAA